MAIAVSKECDGGMAAHELYDQRAGGNAPSGQEQPTGHEHEIGQPNGDQRVG